VEGREKKGGAKEEGTLARFPSQYFLSLNRLEKDSKGRVERGKEKKGEGGLTHYLHYRQQKEKEKQKEGREGKREGKRETHTVPNLFPSVSTFIHSTRLKRRRTKEG